MEEIRSNPSEEGLEPSEQNEEIEKLDEVTHEAEAHLEKTGDIEQAEVVEGLVKDMVKGTPEVVDQTQPPGTSDAPLDGVKEPEGGDEATPINLPGPQNEAVDVGSLPIPIPREADEISESKGSISHEAPDPGPFPPDDMPAVISEDVEGMVKGEAQIADDPNPPGPDPDNVGMLKGTPEISRDPEPPGPDPDRLSAKGQEVEGIPVPIPGEDDESGENDPVDTGSATHKDSWKGE